jgi:octaprenyl-diphosphate synthase
LSLLGRTRVSEPEYLDVLQRKTAYLFSACCEVGALLGGASERQRQALADYGLNLGTAFQLVDDLLDFTASDDALGKATGVDLIAGKVTLPLIYLVAGDNSACEMVETVIRERNYSTVSRSDLLGAVDRVGGLEQARARADAFAEAARASLDVLPDSEYCEALRSIPTYVLERER